MASSIDTDSQKHPVASSRVLLSMTSSTDINSQKHPVSYFSIAKCVRPLTFGFARDGLLLLHRNESQTASHHTLSLSLSLARARSLSLSPP
jgi:hypothetical protein